MARNPFDISIHYANEPSTGAIDKDLVKALAGETDLGGSCISDKKRSRASGLIANPLRR